MENFILFVSRERTNGRVEIFEVLKGKEREIYVTGSLRTGQEGTELEYFVFSNWGQLILEEMLTERRGNTRRWGNLSRWQGRNSWLLGNLEKKFITVFFFKYFQEGVNCSEHRFLIDVVSMILWLTLLNLHVLGGGGGYAEERKGVESGM